MIPDVAARPCGSSSLSSEGAAAVVWVAGARLARYANVFGDRTGIGKALPGRHFATTRFRDFKECRAVQAVLGVVVQFGSIGAAAAELSVTSFRPSHALAKLSRPDSIRTTRLRGFRGPRWLRGRVGI
jgi:hypothetical protein